MAGKWIHIGCVCLVVSACASRTLEDVSHSENVARRVSHVTSGVIAATDPVRIRFVSPLVDQERVGQVLQDPVFSFTPAVDGIARWEDPRTLRFDPHSPLAFRETYRGRLDLAALFPRAGNVEPLVFSFTVAGRELRSVDADFRLKDAGDPRELVFEGTVGFTAPASPDLVEKAASLVVNGDVVSLTWSRGSGEGAFHFVSAPIARRQTAQKVTLSIAGERLDLSQGFEKEWTLPPPSELALVEVQPEEDGAHPSVRMTFSDELDPRQDLTGLITVKPAREVDLEARGKGVTVRGDFAYGKACTLTVHAGVRSRWGVRLDSSVTKTVQFEDLKPQVRFAQDGVFLPSANRQKIRFQTLNLKRVRLKAQRVFESNLGQFLQTQQFEAARDRSRDFPHYEIGRVGVTVVDTVLEIGQERNRWLQHELDLDRLIAESEKGLFLIGLRFEHKDMLYGAPGEAEVVQNQRRWWRGGDFFSNPFSPGYLHRYGQAHKPVIASDIGLTYKKADRSHRVYATRLADALPMNGVTVTLRTFQNQVLARAQTDDEGTAVFSGVEGDVFYVEGEKDGQRSVIKLNEMGWNLSTFDTGGQEAPAGGTRAFLYTDRGVYRPGDEIHLSAIVRNENHTFPENHPVGLKLFNPTGQLVHEETQRRARDGFYSFAIRTAPDDPTGNWRAEVKAGSRTFSHTLKIETVAPFRLKVQVKPEQDTLDAGQRMLRADVESRYLFGNPGSGLHAKVEIRLTEVNRTFPAFQGFGFANEAMEFRPVQQTIFNGSLDAQGRAQVQWRLPDLSAAPSGIRARLTARVLEKGGRPNLGYASVEVNPFPVYVGLQRPAFDYGYAQTGTEVQAPAVAVTPEGEAAAGRSLNYRIYKNTTHWWWEYERQDQFRLRFKEDRNTTLLTSGTLVSQERPVDLVFTPEDQGEYLVEVQDGEDGHTAAFFMAAYPWGRAAGGGKDAGAIALKADRAQYAPGETAVVTFPAPQTGRILVSVEGGNRVFHTQWYDPQGTDALFQVNVPVTEAMAPTAYVSVSIIQPHSQTANDRPMRMYGVTPLNVVDAGARQELMLETQPVLRPREPFEVVVQTADHQPTQFTLAVVDEGLLDLTGFETPDPWAAFYSKVRLGVETFDLFSYVIGALKGDVFRTFSIGGGVEEAYRQSQLADTRTQRFKPVALFRGPLMTDARGRATVRFDMPNYMGAVRVMAVATSGRRYGHADRSVPVKSDLMVLPTLPRALGPGDRFVLPATVFAMRNGIGDVAVSVDVEGPVSVVGENRRTVSFDASGEKDVRFELKADAAVGEARIRVEARSGDASGFQETELAVRASAPRMYASEEKTVQPGETVSLAIPDRGIAGSNRARLHVQSRPNLNFSHRLLWLVQYPYGCIEQVVSAAFPQVYLKEVLKATSKPADVEAEIDRHINAAIDRLRTFQLPSGAFSYWPGRPEPSAWGTPYAGHFLVVAREQGYFVPDDLWGQWVRNQHSQAMTTRDALMVRVYRTYVLALAGEAPIGPMNLIRENHLQEMTDVEKWLLAAAYRLAGAEGAASDILRRAGTSVSKYPDFNETFGSALRDKGILLDLAVLFKRWDIADPLAEEVAQALSTRTWYSTQTTGFMLLGLGRYLQAVEGEGELRLAGTVALPGGETVAFSTDSPYYELELTSGFGQAATVRLDTSATVQRAFATLAWNGVPLKSTVGEVTRNLGLTVRWLDDNGMTVDPANLPQGSRFWGHFQVWNLTRARVQDAALVQVLPAGWEISPSRLHGAGPPSWAGKLRLNQETYADFRDDRAMWFFDLPPSTQPLDFLLQINAVTEGTFTLPPAIAEAMYNNNYQATKPAREVMVTRDGP